MADGVNAVPHVPQGWYPTEPGLQRYWDGSQWTEHVAPHQPPTAPVAQPQPNTIVVVGGPRSMRASGLTRGQHIFHGTLTLITVGLWAPVWWWKASMGSRKIQ